MSYQPRNFRETRELVKLSQHVLAASYNTLDAERLRSTVQSPKYVLRTAWPLMLVEFSDLVQGIAMNSRRFYTADEIRNANEICDIFSSLPYTREVKKMVLVRAKTNKTWRELATLFKIAPWQDCRKTCEMVLVHLIQAAAMDRYKMVARINREKYFYQA